MSAIWESANWTRQFGIRQTGNRQFGMLPMKHHLILQLFVQSFLFTIFIFILEDIVCSVSSDTIHPATPSYILHGYPLLM